MGVKNYILYKVTDHARERIQTRFNITKGEVNTWLTRLLAQSVFVQKQGNWREKYRLNDIVVIVDTHQKQVITAYSENEHDDNLITTPTNPEVKSAINEALDTLIKQKKVKTAGKVYDNIEMMMDAAARMQSPHTNYRFTDRAWDELITAFQDMKEYLESGIRVIQEAQEKIAEK